MSKPGCCYNCPRHTATCRSECTRAAEETILRAILKSAELAENKRKAVVSGYISESSRRTAKARPRRISHKHP